VSRDVLFYEVVHNLVLEMTRTSIEVKNMQMRVESIAGRLDFNERRARALEAVVQYRPDAVGDPGAHGHGSQPRGEAAAPSGVDPITGGESLRSRRRRRRRGRRSGPGFAAPGEPMAPGAASPDEGDVGDEHEGQDVASSGPVASAPADRGVGEERAETGQPRAEAESPRTESAGSGEGADSDRS
jgi:hypothetical protein